MHAVMLFSTANALRQAMGAPLPPIDRPAYDSAISACIEKLGESAFADAWRRAAARSFFEVVEEIEMLNKKPRKNGGTKAG